MVIERAAGSTSARRIKQHFGYGSADIYAVQLCHWLPEALEGRLELQVWRFAADIPSTVIQEIEDGLWRQQPMFGRLTKVASCVSLRSWARECKYSAVDAAHSTNHSRWFTIFQHL
ncbi:hypothetical protein [Pseudomonas citronellolis]|uniref:hypothetical protein n=1 Tax=Pseudomonas citronellolis TaxID=53408 RepID=UPI00248E7182|nr:hypothetical protein [Pseudomonas citronellolis]